MCSNRTPKRFLPSELRAPETILCEAFQALGRPVLSGVPVGHEDDARPVRLGAQAGIEPAGPGQGRLTAAP